MWTSSTETPENGGIGVLRRTGTDRISPDLSL